jgi:hypothetical protein
MAMPPGYPDPADFQPGQIQEHRPRWEFHRDADRGGQNVGQDFFAPEGSMVVDFETHETSRHNTRGAPDIRLATVSSRPLNLPRGVHGGIRRTPDDFPTGAGASFTGDVVMKIVSQGDWFARFLQGGF